MSRRLVIAGAGGFGRGIYSWVSQSPRHCDEHEISQVAFIDDSAKTRDAPVPVIATIQSYEPLTSDVVLCAVAAPLVRRDIVRLLAERGAEFHSFVDDRAILAPDVTLGVGVVICPGVVVSAAAAIGNHVHINFNCSIGHDTTIGAFTTLSPSVNVMGGVRIGEEAFLGGSAAVLPRLVVPDRVTVGAGAVCVRDAEPGQTLVGTPASELKGKPTHA